MFFENACFAVSTILSFSVFYLLKYRQELPLFSSRQAFFFNLSYVLLPNLAWEIAGLIGCFYYNSPDEKIVDYSLDAAFGVRIFYMVYNIANYIACDVMVSNIRKENARVGFETPTPKETAIKTLISRIRLYPIVQVCSRIFSIIYISKYGENRDQYIGWSSGALKTQYAIRLLANCTTFCNSIGTFVAFLIVQPNALNRLKIRLGFDVFITEEDYIKREIPSEPESSIAPYRPDHTRLTDNNRDSSPMRQSFHIMTSSRDTEASFKVYTEQELLDVISGKLRLETNVRITESAPSNTSDGQSNHNSYISPMYANPTSQNNISTTINSDRK